MSNRAAPAAVWVIALLLAGGCHESADRPAGDDRFTSYLDSTVLGPLTMNLTSTAFEEGQPIPAVYTGIGRDISPPLAWSNVPEGTKSLALLCDDPDAPSRSKPRPEGPWVHWVLYNIPAERTELSEAIERVAEPAGLGGARQGRNDFPSDHIGYRGPMPPEGSGPHRYFFNIFALDCQLDLKSSRATKATLLEAIQSHVLAEGQLMGTFERK